MLFTSHLSTHNVMPDQCIFRFEAFGAISSHEAINIWV